jgi:hypothetical protein
MATRLSESAAASARRAPSSEISDHLAGRDDSGAGFTSGALFLEGAAGTGKTTAAVQRLLYLLDQGHRASSLLVLVPQRTLGLPYLHALRSRTTYAGSTTQVLTVGGLARRWVALFWPLIAARAGFANPDRPPTFLTLETAQYHMARLVRPLMEEQGLFDSVTIDRNRLYSQILDNLNKAAVVGFVHTEIGHRLQMAWMGEAAQAHVYADAQRCAELFRQHCLQHNLLDFSLQLEIFRDYLWPMPACRNHLQRTFRHLIADNIEEDTPFTHDLLRDWLPSLDSALLIYDQRAGYRQFLGADPQSAYALKGLCQHHLVFDESHVTSPALQSLGVRLGRVLDLPPPAEPTNVDQEAVRNTLVYEYFRYYPDMLDWVARQIATLIAKGTPPGEIVILAPFLSDALRFSLINRLERIQVPARSHRPSRALRDEPATRCLLTLAAIAHPQWGICPSRFDFAYALMLAIDEMDLVRAQLLAEIVYRVKEGSPNLSSFEDIYPEMRDRITYVIGGRYDTLRLWLTNAQQQTERPLDHFLSRLFGEILSQPGFGFFANHDAGRVAATLVESVQKFRWGVGPTLTSSPENGEALPPPPLGYEYAKMVEDGVIAAQYIRSWQDPTDQQVDAVLLAPAYTFLMSNRPVNIQFWLDVGSHGWFQRLYQPLTHPYVLSRQWETGKAWTDGDEFATSQQRLYHLTLGLLARCRQQIYLGLSELSEQGFEHRGPLLWAINHVLQKTPI